MAKVPGKPQFWIMLLPALGLLAALGWGAFLIFDYGRYKAGFDRISAKRERNQYLEEIQILEERNSELREQVALFETSKEVDREGYRQVEDNLVELQAKILAQQEDLAFYRSIVSPSDSKSGLRIQEFQVQQRPEKSLFRLRLVLVQSKKHDRRVSGVVNLSVTGARDGLPVSYELADLSPAGLEAERMAYSFKYFQDFEEDVILPEGFQPDRVNVEVRPNSRSAKPIKQSFDWALKKS